MYHSHIFPYPFFKIPILFLSLNLLYLTIKIKDMLLKLPAWVFFWDLEQGYCSKFPLPK